MNTYKILILLVAISFAACKERQKPVDITKQNNTGNKTSKYEIGQVNEKPLSSYVKLPGQLKPYEEVNIFAKVNGFVKQVLADRGSVVKKGQLLITLEAPEIESQLQAAMSKYLQARENALASKEKYRRLKDAAKEEGAVAPLDLDNAFSKMKADEALEMSEKSNVSLVQNIRNYLEVPAPFNGTIVQRNVSSGALVGPGSKGNDQPMLVLQHLQQLRLEVLIPEVYVDKVDLKSPVHFSFTTVPGKENVARISRTANALTSLRSEAIEIDINNSSLQLKPGMYAEVKIPLLSDANSLLVPGNAIVRSTERQYVIVVKGGKAVFTDIREGLTNHNFTEVFGALQSGDEIILHATDEIKEGTVVK